MLVVVALGVICHTIVLITIVQSLSATLFVMMAIPPYAILLSIVKPQLAPIVMTVPP